MNPLLILKMKPAIKGKEAINGKAPIIDPTLPLKRGRKPKCAEVEFIIPESIFNGLVVSSPTTPLKKHTRRPPYN